MNPNLITAYLVDLINSSDMPDHKRDEGLLYARQLRACPNIDGLRSCVSDQNRLIWAYQGTIELIQRGQLPRIEKQEVPPRRQAWMLLEYAMKVETGHSMGRVFKCGPRQMSTERGAAVRILHQDYNYAYRGIAQRIGCSFGSFFYLEKKAEAILMAARLRDIMWDAYNRNHEEETIQRIENVRQGPVRRVRLDCQGCGSEIPPAPGTPFQRLSRQAAGGGRKRPQRPGSFCRRRLYGA